MQLGSDLLKTVVWFCVSPNVEFQRENLSVPKNFDYNVLLLQMSGCCPEAVGYTLKMGEMVEQNDYGKIKAFKDICRMNRCSNILLFGFQTDVETFLSSL